MSQVPTPTVPLLKKSVATIALWPVTGNISFTAKLAYNSMVLLAQGMKPDEDGGFSVAVSQIVKAYGSSSRYTARVREYIGLMVGQRVQWTPLTDADVSAAQAQIAAASSAIATEPVADRELERVFSLLSEARFFMRSGELWVTYFFPPTLKLMILQPTRYALVDILDQAKLSTYAASTLFEICCRYRDVPGGKTNRASVQWWARTLRGSAEEKPREWRKVKNETLKPALAEIAQRTGLTVELIEHKQGRTVTEAQFQLTRQLQRQVSISENLDLIGRAEALQIPEQEVDRFVDMYGRNQVDAAIGAMEARQRSKPHDPILLPSSYLDRTLKNGVAAPLDSPVKRPTLSPKPRVVPATMPLVLSAADDDERLKQRARSLAQQAVRSMTVDQLEPYAAIARQSLRSDNVLDQSLIKRFDKRQYASPLVEGRIAEAFAQIEFGPDWIRLINEAHPDASG